MVQGKPSLPQAMCRAPPGWLSSAPPLGSGVNTAAATLVKTRHATFFFAKSVHQAMDPPKRQLLSRRSGTKTIGLLAELGLAAKLLPGANPLGSLPSHGVDQFHHGLTLCLTLCM